MRTFAVLVVGIALGVVLTFSGVQMAGGWYTYRTLPPWECHDMPPSDEVVPGQPNPCHFRRPRWPLFH